MDDPYLKTQIITYLGNKRKLLNNIEEIVLELKKTITITTGKQNIIMGDGFSGSGVVSRMLKKHSNILYTNDLAGYSETLNKCYLDTPNITTINLIKQYIDEANKYVENPTVLEDKWIQKHWAPLHSEIKINDRVYYTLENAKRIDKYRQFINNLPEKYRPYLLAPLLVESSIHNNTNGQFAAYYKEFGGTNKIDIKRITGKIILKMPIFNSHKCNIIVSKQDTNEWIKNISNLDIVYYDPPYNKHPYHIYYFLLDIINNWDITQDIPNTYRGQPTNWVRSDYNSSINAYNTFEDLIKNTKAKYIIISYNNKGIIPIEKLELMLKKYGELTKKIVEHKTYNKLKGIANYKRKTKNKPIKEFIYILQTLI